MKFFILFMLLLWGTESLFAKASQTDSLNKAFVEQCLNRSVFKHSDWVVILVDSCGRQQERLIFIEHLENYYQEELGLSKTAYIHQAAEDIVARKRYDACRFGYLKGFSVNPQWQQILERQPLTQVVERFCDSRARLKSEYRQYMTAFAWYFYKRGIHFVNTVREPECILPDSLANRKKKVYPGMSPADSVRHRFISRLVRNYYQSGAWAVVDIDSCNVQWKELVPVSQIYQACARSMIQGGAAVNKTAIDMTIYNLFRNAGPYDRCNYASIKGHKADSSRLAYLKKQPLQQVLSTCFDKEHRVKPEYKPWLVELVWYCYLHQVPVLTFPGKTACYELLK